MQEVGSGLALESLHHPPHPHFQPPPPSELSEKKREKVHLEETETSLPGEQQPNE